jgi:SAM-dependent methyltransferase
MTTTLSFEEIKKVQHGTWSSGAYGKIAWLTAPLADALCEAVDLRAGSRVLDVATGTGHVALAAARRLCDVSAIDYVPALIDEAAHERPPRDCRSTSRRRTPRTCPSRMTPLRVCKAGGTVGVLSWTPAGFIGQMLKVVGGHAPPPPGTVPAVRWGTDDAIRGMFGSGVDELTFTTGVVTQRMPSAEFFADFFLEHYGPTLKASQRRDPDGRRALRDDLNRAGLSETSWVGR